MSDAVLLVAFVPAAGAAALARAEMAGRLNRPEMPFGTLVVNLIGSFGIGLVASLVSGRAGLVIVGVAFIGTFSTFSSFARDAVDLSLDQRRWVAASLYVLVTIIGCVALAWAGTLIGEAITPPRS